MDSLNDIEVRLWEFIDGGSSDAERSAIERLIAENAEWRAKYQELLEVHRSLNMVELEEPSLRFTRNVMEEIAKFQIAPATRTYINKKVIVGIGLFFLTMVVAFLVYGVSQIDWKAAGDSGSTLGLDLTRVDYSQVFNNTFVNLFILLNVVLGLVLLDRYLSNKNKQLMKEA